VPSSAPTTPRNSCAHADHRAVRYSTVQYSTVLYGTVHYCLLVSILYARASLQVPSTSLCDCVHSMGAYHVVAGKGSRFVETAHVHLQPQHPQRTTPAAPGTAEAVSNGRRGSNSFWCTKFRSEVGAPTSLPCTLSLRCTQSKVGAYLPRKGDAEGLGAVDPFADERHQGRVHRNGEFHGELWRDDSCDDQ